jgi:hypothetical protein
MFRVIALVSAVFFWVLTAMPATAHCDGEDGPVAMAAHRALESGNVNVALPYAPASAEAEIIAKFRQARSVRTHGRQARDLADRAFVETVVRLHRLGEGASYTGLRTAGTDYGPMIPAADGALESGDLANVRAMLIEEIDHGLNGRLAHARELRSSVTIEPRTHDGVAAARERVSAELGFIAYAEGLRQPICAAANGRHE